jgi:hypothetical protein
MNSGLECKGNYHRAKRELPHLWIKMSYCSRIMGLNVKGNYLRLLE